MTTVEDAVLVRQADVLPWIPEWMRADFDCPAQGAHDWFPRVTTRGTHYTWCRHCNRRKVDPWPDTHPHDVIADLTFSR